MSSRSRGRKLDVGGGHGDDLMITPLLDMFVALIPFLIVSLVLSRINVADVGVSKPVKTLTQAQQNDVKFDLFVKISEKHVDVMLNGKVIKSVDRAAGGLLAKDAKPGHENDGWINMVRIALIEVKRKYPDQFKVRVEPDAHVTLQALMAFMDGARKLRPEDGEIMGKDEKGQPVKLQFLFPNIILKGIYG